MDEMIIFFRSLTNVTLSAAAIGSLYPQDLYLGTDWMLQSSGTHRPLPVIYLLCFLQLKPQSFLQLWRQTWKGLVLDLTTSLWASVKRSARCVTSQQWPNFELSLLNTKFGGSLVNNLYDVQTLWIHHFKSILLWYEIDICASKLPLFNLRAASFSISKV